jgi:26S proteasome regulatory subunit N3
MPPKKTTKGKGKANKASKASKKTEPTKDVDMKDASPPDAKEDEPKLEDTDPRVIAFRGTAFVCVCVSSLSLLLPCMISHHFLPCLLSLFLSLITAVRDAAISIGEGVAGRDNRYVTRVMRKLNRLRRRTDSGILHSLIQNALQHNDVAQTTLLDFLTPLKDDTFDKVLTMEQVRQMIKLEEEAAESAKKKKKNLIPAETDSKLAEIAKKAADEKLTDADREKMEKAAAEKKKKEEAEVVAKAKAAAKRDAEREQAEKLILNVPETEIFLQLLIVLKLIDSNQTTEALNVAADLVGRTTDANRRTMDLLTAKAWYYYSLCHERAGTLSSVRPALIAAHRTACLRHDEPSQIALTNAILRSYLLDNLYSQADQFRNNIHLPQTALTSADHARYLYYIGKINLVQLQYGEALSNLTQAVRKGPRSGAIGFRQQAQKLLVLVELLMGDIPERAVFRTPDLRRSLQPYLLLTQAVRVGDLNKFKDVMDQNKGIFMRDGVFSLIVRLRQNVIRTGLRKINLSYSRISLQDIATKLRLDSAEDTEYIVAKSIHDGVIDAVIDRSAGFVYSRETTDVYVTREPQQAYHKRIQFCMEVHNSAVKGMRFPPNAHRMRPADDDDSGDEFDF